MFSADKNWYLPGIVVNLLVVEEVVVVSEIVVDVVVVADVVVVVDGIELVLTAPSFKDWIFELSCWRVYTVYLRYIYVS